MRSKSRSAQYGTSNKPISLQKQANISVLKTKIIGILKNGYPREVKSVEFVCNLLLIRSSSLKLLIILFHIWANFASSFSLLVATWIRRGTNHEGQALLTIVLMIQNDVQTSSNLREKVAFNPFFLVFSFFSTGIKHALKAPGSDWNRDLSIPSVRIWKEKGGSSYVFQHLTQINAGCGMISQKVYIYSTQDKSFLLQQYFKAVLKLKSP